ncbi:MAG: PEP-CTERM sorting domain-containing protein [Verrucomicrobia bacterium]|nr:PEP-CTERM sorting domain-containing protein [Verrucomicrobiota bacterium]
MILGPLASESEAETFTNVLDGVVTNAGGAFFVGSNGAFNVLIITNAAALTDTSGTIGNSAISSNNTALVTGSGSIWTNSINLIVGRTGSFNQLSILDGASVFNTTGFVASASASANNTVLVSGGSVWSNTAGLFIGSAGDRNTMTISNGGRVFSTTGNIGDAAGADGNRVVLTGTNSLWAMTSTLTVGDQGDNIELTIADGALVTNATTIIGFLGTNNLTLVTGTGSLWRVSGNLTIGTSGDYNQFVVTNGGRVLTTGDSTLGSSLGFRNSALVSGSNSLWSIGGNLSVANVGVENSVTINAGGTLSNVNGTIGGNSPRNSVTVDGDGSLWNNSGTLTIGSLGDDNRLVVTNGGRVISLTAVIGDGSGSASNRATVSGAGSLWQNAGRIIVGDQGSTNSLIVANGGRVTATNLLVGATASSVGNQVIVSGGTLQITNAAGTALLDLRRGTLAINSGTVTVNRLVATNGASSVMDFNGGTLNTAGSTVSNGVQFVVGDGVSSATLNLQGGTHSFANGLSLQTNASLTGIGTILGTTTNFGTIAPGNSAGTLNFNGDLWLEDSSILEMELAATNIFDRVIVAAAMKAGGILNVSLINGFNPQATNTFDLFDFGSMAGIFNSVNLPALNPGLSWDTSKLYTAGEIAVVPEPSTYALMGVGLAALAWRRKRKHL